MSQSVTLQFKANTKPAAADIEALNGTVKAAFADMRERVAALNVQMRELAFDPHGILAGTDQAERGITAVHQAMRLVVSGMRGLQSESLASGETLKALGIDAAGTEKKLTGLAAGSGTLGTALGDMAKGAEAADIALDSLDEGAATAQKSVSGLGRVTGNLLPRLESLSAVVFDPVGIVGGADTAVTALGRVKIAAAEAKASIRSAGSSVPVFVRGGSRTAEGADTFAGGLRAGVGAVGDVAGAAAVGATLIGGVSTRNAIDFDSQAQVIAGNTNMSAADQAAMRQAGLQAMRLGLDPGPAMKSFMHISNHKFAGQEATNISNFAAKTAVGTGADQEQIGNATSALLHELNMKATPENVSRIGNMQHQSMASGNMDMDKYVKYGAPAIGKATALGNSPADSAAFISALTQQSVPTPQAATNLAGITWQVTHPNAKAQKAIDGAGLSQFFGPDALKTYGLHGILDATWKGVNGDKSRLMSIFGNKQGGFGALIATGKGAADYTDQLYNPKTGNLATLQGKTKPAEERFAQQSEQPAQKLKMLKGELTADSIELGEKFIPVLTASLPLLKMLAENVLKAVNAVSKLPRPIQEAIVAFAGFKILSSFLPLLSGFGLLTEKTTALLGGMGKMLLGIAPEAAEGGAALSGPFAAGILAAVAAAAALALAWKTDFGGIREAFAPFLADVKKTFGGSTKDIQSFINTTLPDLKKFVAEVEPLFRVHFMILGAIVKVAFDVIKAVVKGALAVVGGVVRTALALLTGDWKGAWEGIGSIFQGQWAAILGFVNDVAPKLVATVKALGTHLLQAAQDAGQQLINGIVGGIKAGIGRVGSAVASVAQSAISGITTALDIHSPSRVMQKLGLNTAEGLAQGIRDGRVSVEQASRLLANTPAAIVRNAISVARRGQSAQRKRATEARSAGEFAATAGESPEEKELHRLSEDRARGLISAQQYAAAYTRIKALQNQKSETEARRHADALQQIHEGLAAFTKNPDTPSLDNQEESAHADYRRQIAALGGNTYGPHSKTIEIGMQDAGKLLQDKLGAIQQQRDDKAKADATAAAEEADAAEKQAQATTVQLNRELWQHAGGDMKAYFQSLRDEAAAALKAVTDKFGPESAHPNAPAVQAATAQNAAQNLLIDQQQTDAVNSLADERQQHDLEQGKITLANYIDYLTKRRDAYQQYSQEWLDLDSRLYSADEELQKKQLQSIEDLFQAHKISLEAYKKMLSDLATQVPVTSSVHQDVLRAADGAETKDSKGQMIGGSEFWDDLAGSAAENGSKVLTALFHPKDKKKIFKSMWEDLLGSLEGSVTGQFSKMLKNLLTGDGSGGGGLFGSLFGGLFGHSKSADKNADQKAGMTSGNSPSGLSPILAGLSPFLAGSTQIGIGGAVGHGLNANLLNPFPQIGQMVGQLGGLGKITGINGPLTGLNGGAGSKTGGMSGVLDIASLAASFLPGGGLLAKLFKNGGLLGGLAKLFHFSGGGIVPGTGNHDSVPAMLTPGEIVIPKALAARLQQAALPQAKMVPGMPGTTGSTGPGGIFPQGTTTGAQGQSGGSHIEINSFGDSHYHYEQDEVRSQQKLARTLEDLLRSGVPA